jgi:hypothetical protein
MPAEQRLTHICTLSSSGTQLPTLPCSGPTLSAAAGAVRSTTNDDDGDDDDEREEKEEEDRCVLDFLCGDHTRGLPVSGWASEDGENDV